MKLTKKQKCIVDKIISGEVYDIPSYLRVFNKGREQQYDASVIQATFDRCENGMTYFFRKTDGNVFYTDIYNEQEVLIKTLPVANEFTSDLHSNPISERVKAELDMKIPPEHVHCAGKSFHLDFLKKPQFVADSFDSIKDFVALWSYLRKEALVFEGSKQIREDDISIFFEFVDQELLPQENPHWKAKHEIESKTNDDSLPLLRTEMVPNKKANCYLEKAWKFNQDQFDMCSDYIGVKMMATSELKNYQQNKYRTEEQEGQRKNLIVAWIAVGISVVSVLVGNIYPVFQKSETDYLNMINRQLTEIEEIIAENDTRQEVLNNHLEINKKLEDITKLLEQLSSEETSEALGVIISNVEKIHDSLVVKPEE